MAYSIQCAGTVTQVDASTLQCSNAWGIVDIPLAFDAATLDPLLIAGAVGAGAFALLPLWAALIGIKMLLQSIKH